HVDDAGRSASEYDFDSFVFTRPVVLRLTKGESEMVAAEELEEHASEIREADLLLIKTGFQDRREKDPAAYMNRNPGMSAAAAEYLATFPRLRALGFDFISLSAVQNREEGRKAHRALLKGRDFFIVEDMDLARVPKGLKRVFVVPLFIEGIDSVPCTVVGEA
ncbi:MAG TPA: cyclase family protein, partial [Conexivisphaerales archaeon]|nr:cyclase family protein [Conexivisphaerales archaeon]